MKDSFSDHRLPRNNPRNWLRGYPIISDQISPGALEIVCSQLEDALGHHTLGAIVEFGCYAGTTSLFIRRILDNQNQSASREFHVYDSFEGLPKKTTQDANAAGIDFEAGKLYISKKEFLRQFQDANLRPPIAHKGWFNQLADKDVPNQIAFAFLDGDFYDSIISSLRLVWPRLSKDGVILVDDFQRETLPGVARAIHDFFRDKSITLQATQNIAIIRRA